jgi:hypothetical protein
LNEGEESKGEPIVNGFDPVLGATFNTKPGIHAGSSGTAAANNAVTMNIASTIQMFGPATPGPRITNNGVAIRALSFVDAPIFINYTGPGITTGSCVSILPLSGSGAIAVNSSGPITTNGTVHSSIHPFRSGLPLHLNGLTFILVR